MQFNNFNLLTVTTVLHKQLKQIALFVVVCLAIATMLVFLLPKYYKSTAIVVAANPALADKARLFNNNIQGLYSNFGSGDDLDRIDGLAHLDTTFKLLVTEFNLTNYYELKDSDMALRIRKAILLLREDVELQKTELSQFKFMVTTKDKTLSANIANRMVQLVEQMIETVWQKNYLSSLQKIEAATKALETEVGQINNALPTTTATDVLTFTNKREALLQQLKQYYTAANEFKLAIENKAPSLYIVEQATPAAKHYKPNKLNILVATTIISFVFACMLVLIIEGKKYR